MNKHIYEVDTGWLCGIIDGEGNFTIRIHFHETKSLGKRARFGPQLVICNSDLNIIEKAERILNAFEIKNRKYVVRRSLKNPNHQDLWHLIIMSTGLRILIPMVMPFIEKRREAELLMQVLDYSKSRGSSNPYTNEELIKIDELRKELISLHGNSAKKLSKNMAQECNIPKEELDKYIKKQRENSSNMVNYRYNK